MARSGLMASIRGAGPSESLKPRAGPTSPDHSQPSDRTGAKGAQMFRIHSQAAATAAARGWWWRLLGDRGASISPMFALLLIPISGSIAFAVELSGMQYVQRSAQNAADAAALAAATNNSSAGTTYLMEARAAARPYGYVNGQSNVTVTSAPVTCPTGTPAGSTCYEAVVTDTFPLIFSRVIGFLGTGGNGSQSIYARAVATSAGGGVGTQSPCAWSKSSDSDSFTSNGGPNPNMTGCVLFSNGGMTCTGHDLNAAYGIAVGTNNPQQPCGTDDYPGRRISGATPISDPYDAHKSFIPTTAASPACSGTYHQLTGNGANVTVNVANRVGANNQTTTPIWTNTQKRFCGDIQLQGDVTLTGNTVLVIENGRLDLNGHWLRTAAGGSATIIFTGNNNTLYRHYPMSTKNNGAGLDIEAPTSGNWSGVAIYQDPAVTTNVSFEEAGSNPTWNITGLVYLPNANVGFSGVVNKAADGVSCFVLVANKIATNGTAQIFANTQCNAAGLSLPQVTIGTGGTREKLVL